MKSTLILIFIITIFSGCFSSGISKKQKQEVLNDYLIKRANLTQYRYSKSKKVKKKIVIVPENIAVIYKNVNGAYFGFGSTGYIKNEPCRRGQCNKFDRQRYKNWNSKNNVLRLLNCKDFRKKEKIIYHGREGEVLFCNKPKHPYEKSYENLYTKEIQRLLRKEQATYSCVGWWLIDWEDSCLINTKK
jgi:hypothetical protein